MTVEQASALPEGPEWEYEYAWPGDRVIVTKIAASIRLISLPLRRDLTNRFPVVAAAIAKLPATDVIIDGTVGTLDRRQWAVIDGTDDPGTSDAPFLPRLVAADLLWQDGLDVRQFPLVTRRERLRALLQGTSLLVTPIISGSPAELLQRALEVGAVGVIAKRRDSRYRPFARSRDWVQVAVGRRQPGRAYDSRGSATPWALHGGNPGIAGA